MSPKCHYGLHYCHDCPTPPQPTNDSVIIMVNKNKQHTIGWMKRRYYIQFGYVTLLLILLSIQGWIDHLPAYFNLENSFLLRTTMTMTHRYLNVMSTKATKTMKPIYVDDDGYLQVRRMPEVPPCRYFTDFGRETKLEIPTTTIRGIHYHFDDCAENQLGNRLGEHYLHYLLANSAQILYRMSCGGEDTAGNKMMIQNNQSTPLLNVTNSTTATYVEIIDPTSHQKSKHQSVLRHLEVNRIVPGPVPHDPWGGQVWEPSSVCQHCNRGGWWCHFGLNVMMDIIQEDMMKLSQTDVGQSFEPDDAVIHLRLGDALKGTKDERIGLLPHRTYQDMLDAVQREFGPIRTIGIVTMPFKRSLARSFDSGKVTLAKSKLVAHDLIDYLKGHFPNATVVLHSGPDEVPLKAFARLQRARKVAICGPSTFCTMPVLATSASVGYLFRGKKHSPWAMHVAQLSPNNHLRMYKVPRLANNYTEKLNHEQIVFWLRHQLPHVGEFTIDGPPLLRNDVVPKGDSDGENSQG
jgi:hypothetical protein